jgi:ATP-dependent Clp protease ATP-binding subunit ClpC
MFNRFTVRARRVLFYARSEVSQLGSSAVEPEHILLGVLDEGNGLGSRILARTGVALDDFRSDIVRRLTGREKVSESEDIPLSASCERALLYAAEEADRLLHNGFELRERVDTPEALIQLLRDEAGLVITRERHEVLTLIVRQST